MALCFAAVLVKVSGDPRLAGDPADVMISPRLGRLGWFDFHRAEEAIAIGAEAAEKSIEALTEAINALSEPCDGNGAAK